MLKERCVIIRSDIPTDGGAESMEVRPLPFLKWAGGKRWFFNRHVNELPRKFNCYFEPFLGGGAVFFGLRPARAVLSDINAELIETYVAVKTQWSKVQDLLKQHHEDHSPEHYYTTRASRPETLAGRAARCIYLNRTCWNGLYRVNLRGSFNVPLGSKSSVILSSDNFEHVHLLLQRAELLCGDFSTVIARARRKDLVFVDPPYTVRHNQNGFVKYNETLFTWQDQLRLRDDLVNADSRGALIVATNADHPSIRQLYRQNFKLRRVSRQSVLAADPARRTQSTEMLITNF
jgi:DNA adenine methylase